MFTPSSSSPLAVFETACGVVHEEWVVSSTGWQSNRPGESPRPVYGACARVEQSIVDHGAENEHGKATELRPEQKESVTKGRGWMRVGEGNASMGAGECEIGDTSDSTRRGWQ